MSTKKLIILLVVFVCAAALVGISKLMEKDEGSIIEESGYEDIAPEEFLKTDVAWFEVWRGGKEDTKVIINRTEDSWSVGSRYNAPADTDKVDKFLDLYKGLMGIVRSTSADVLPDYNLTSDQAVHIKIVMKGDTKKPLELLVGKESGFVRKEGDNTVYAIDRDFNEVLGIYGDTDTPEGSKWLDKKILSLEKDAVAGLQVTYPDKKLVFEKKEKETPSADAEKEEDNKDAEKNKKKEYEWHIVSGIPEGLGAKPNPAKKILEKLTDLKCTDAVDPEQKKKWGLDTPGFSLVVTKEDKSTVEIKGGLPETGSSGYVMISGKPHVYELSSWVFTGLFPSGDELVRELPGSPAGKDDIASVTVTNFDGKTFTVVQNKSSKKKDDNKKAASDEKTCELLKPEISLKVKQSELKDIISGISELEAEDFSTEDPGSDLIGLSSPAAQAEVTLRDGKKKIIKIGKRSGTMTGYYLSFEKGTVYAGAEYKVEKVFPKLMDLFEKDLVKIKPDNVVSVTITSATETVKLEKTDKEWKGEEGGSGFETDRKAVRDYLGYFNPLSIDDIAEKEADGKPTDVDLRFKDGGRTRLRLRKGKDIYTVSAADKKGVFTIDKMTYERAAALFVKFKKEKPVKKESKEEKNEDGNDADSKPAENSKD